MRVFIANEKHVNLLAACAFGLEAIVKRELIALGFDANIVRPGRIRFRGDFGDKDWWAQPHGTTMMPVLEALNVPYQIVERDEDIAPTIARAYDTLHSSKYPVAVIFSARVCQ